MTDEPPADLAPDRIRGLLRTERFGQSLDVQGSTGSTMDDAAGAAGRGVRDGHVVVADRQVQGRGAHGRGWDSPGGTDLYFSVVSYPALDVAHRAMITLATGLGVAEAAERFSGQPAQIKWPNDVLVRGRKCAGALSETSTRGQGQREDAVILGVGLNVNRRRWTGDLAAIGISLAQAREDGHDVDRAEVLAAALLGMEQWIDRLITEGPVPVAEGVDRRLALRGQRVRCDGIEGILEGVTRSGAARIRTDEGVRDALAGMLVAP